MRGGPGIWGVERGEGKKNKLLEEEMEATYKAGLSMFLGPVALIRLNRLDSVWGLKISEAF